MMSLATLNDSTLIGFVEDKEVFEKCVNENFRKLDVNGDGVLSRDELRKGFRMLPDECESSQQQEPVNKLYDILFLRFDEDKNGGIDKNEFKSLVKEVMLAMARGIGKLPVNVALEQDSMFMKAFEREKSRK